MKRNFDFLQKFHVNYTDILHFFSHIFIVLLLYQDLFLNFETNFNILGVVNPRVRFSLKILIEVDIYNKTSKNFKLKMYS